jgi:quinoprotein dehydrogenase-associated probable ABC transporter substrate-binding protein
MLSHPTTATTQQPNRSPSPTAQPVAQPTVQGNAPQPSRPDADHTLRVCADPDNLPFSNTRKEGFENRIATLLAQDLGDTVSYLWWPHRRGFIRNTIRARECDVLIGVPRGFDPLLETKPYYRSTYYIVTRADRNLHIASLDDPALKTLKIGVNIIGNDYENPPPVHALGVRGVQIYRGYETFYDDVRRPEDIINAVARGDIDVAIAWGPLAGYFAKRASVPLTLVAIPDSVDRSGQPFAFDIALGVRHADKAFKARLEAALDRHSPEIARILKEYNVPTIDRP